MIYTEESLQKLANKQHNTRTFSEQEESGSARKNQLMFSLHIS